MCQFQHASAGWVTDAAAAQALPSTHSLQAAAQGAVPLLVCPLPSKLELLAPLLQRIKVHLQRDFGGRREGERPFDLATQDSLQRLDLLVQLELLLRRGLSGRGLHDVGIFKLFVARARGGRRPNKCAARGRGGVRQLDEG